MNRTLIVLLALAIMACGEAAGPLSSSPPDLLVDCGESPDDPACREDNVPPPTGSIVINVYVCPSKDSIRAGYGDPHCGVLLDDPMWRTPAR